MRGWEGGNGPRRISLWPHADPGALGTYLSWLRMRAVRVDITFPRQPEMAHQGFCTKRPRMMSMPLRGLFTNITWDVPRSTQSRNWKTGDLSGKEAGRESVSAWEDGLGQAHSEQRE